MSSDRIGEVIASNSSFFIAQSIEMPRDPLPRLYDPPPLGAFIKIRQSPALLPPSTSEEEERDPFDTPSALPGSSSYELALPEATYALVCGAELSPRDTGRRPWALGLTDEEELRREQPQLFELLRAEFAGIMIAHSPGKGIPLQRGLPPRPPRIHACVCNCVPEESRILAADLSFLRRILLSPPMALGAAPPDEIAAACIRFCAAMQPDPEDFLVRAGRTLSRIMSNDYNRLEALLEAILGNV